MPKAQSISEVLKTIEAQYQEPIVDLTEVYKPSYKHRFTDSLVDLYSRFTKFQNMTEELIDAEHLNTATNKNSTSSRFQLFKDRHLRVKPTLSLELHQVYEEIKAVEQKILSDFNLVLKSSGLEEKELHLEFSDVHGYHYRVTKRNSTKTFKTLDTKSIKYSILSTQKAGVLFTTMAMETLLKKFQKLKSSYEDMQASIVKEALDVTRTYFMPLLALSKVIAEIDSLCALATVALRHDWIAPLMLANRSKRLEIKDLRHPILEDQLGSLAIVKNDVKITDEKFVQIITGPNMGGKSTYMKSVGIAVLLAHMGSFVPASSACIPVYDRIYYRSGSGDCALMNISSFMSEMMDMAEIIKNSTERSLVLIDELGRGTSTSDGFALAWAILEELGKSNHCTVFCATHFHELNDLSHDVAGLFESVHVDAYVDSSMGDITMLYKVQLGASSRSYGVSCAQIAGFPQDIVNRAKLLEQELFNENSQTLMETDASPVKKRKFDHLLETSQLLNSDS